MKNNKVQILEIICTFWLHVVKFLSKTIRDRKNLYCWKLLEQSIERKETTFNLDEK